MFLVSELVLFKARKTSELSTNSWKKTCLVFINWGLRRAAEGPSLLKERDLHSLSNKKHTFSWVLALTSQAQKLNLLFIT